MIVNATEFDATRDVRFSKPKLNKSGGKSVNVLGPSGATLHLSTPLMLTWGVNEFTDDVTGRRTYDLSLQFPKEEYQTPETQAFLENIVAFQEHFKSEAVEQAKAWFGKSKMSAEVVDALAHPMLRYPKDRDTQEFDHTRPPCLRVKLDYWDQAFNCEIYDIEQSAQTGEHKRLFPAPADSGTAAGPMELIPKGTQIATVLRCGGLWFANGKFGCTWRLVQAVVKPRASLKGRCVIQLSASETKTLRAQADPEGEETEVGVALVDSDEEEEEGGNNEAACSRTLVRSAEAEAEKEEGGP